MLKWVEDDLVIGLEHVATHYVPYYTISCVDGIKKIFCNIRLQTVIFRGTAPTFTQPQFFTYLPSGTLKNGQSIQFQLETKCIFTDAFSIPLKPLSIAPRTLKKVLRNITRRVHARTESGGRHFKHFL